MKTDIWTEIPKSENMKTWKPESWKLESEIRNPKSRTAKLKTQGRYRKCESWDLKTEIRNLNPETWKPETWILNPETWDLNPEFWIMAQILAAKKQSTRLRPVGVLQASRERSAASTVQPPVAGNTMTGPVNELATYALSIGTSWPLTGSWAPTPSLHLRHPFTR